MIVDTSAMLIENAASQWGSESYRRLMPFPVQLVFERASISLSCFASEEWANLSKALPIRPKSSFCDMLASCANSPLVESMDAKSLAVGTTSVKSTELCLCERDISLAACAKNQSLPYSH
jgi:hypothetical protein